MGKIQRWTAGFVSQFDTVLTQIENHEGRVNAAIRESEAARSRARVQLSRVHRDAERMARRREELCERAERWRERALRVPEADEARALECLRRRRRAERELRTLEHQIEEHARIEQQIRADVGRVDQRIEGLRQQRNLLRTRQSRAEALAICRAEDGELACEIDDTLERWEVKVSRLEYSGDCTISDEDDLDESFASQEEADELRAELTALRRREED